MCLPACCPRHHGHNANPVPPCLQVSSLVLQDSPWTRRSVLQKQLQTLKENPEAWNRTIFYARCTNFIEKMNIHSEVCLLQVQSIDIFKSELQRAIYKELTEYWQIDTHGKTTRTFLQRWERRYPSNKRVCRHTEIQYYQILSGKDDFQKQWINQTTWTCAYCSATGKGILFEHLLFNCSELTEQQKRLEKEVRRHCAQYTREKVFDPRISYQVQKFIQTLPS